MAIKTLVAGEFIRKGHVLEIRNRVEFCHNWTPGSEPIGIARRTIVKGESVSYDDEGKETADIAVYNPSKTKTDDDKKADDKADDKKDEGDNGPAS